MPARSRAMTTTADSIRARLMQWTLCCDDTMSIYTSLAMITICSILSSKVIPRHLASPVEEGGGVRQLNHTAPGARTMGSSRVRIYRLAGLKGGSGGQTYRQGCDPPFTSLRSRSTSWNARDRGAEQTTSSQRPECIYRTNDHAAIPAGESRSGA